MRGKKELLILGKAAGNEAVMGGQDVVRERVPAGKYIFLIDFEQGLIAIIAREIGLGGRRCGQCGVEWEAEAFDRNAVGRLVSTCRLCLVSYSEFCISLNKGIK